MTSGLNNTIVGGQAALALTTGSQNVALGRQALYKEDTGSRNIAIGDRALYDANYDGTGYNVAIGHDAGDDISTGVQNTIIGGNAAKANITTGSNNIVIGYAATAAAADSANSVTFGDSNIASIRCQVQTISALSDERDKTNIQDSTYGLDYINSLRPVTFEWNNREESVHKGTKDVGFIAQELQKIDDEYTKLVLTDNPERLEASYARLIPMLVKAIQELSEEVKQLKNK